MEGITPPPKPFLTREETNQRLRTLGFKIGPEVLDYPPGFQSEAFTALQELLMGAIAEWSGLQLEGDQTWEEVNAELGEWAEEWLLG